MTDATNNAERQAVAQLEEIRRMLKAANIDWNRLGELRDDSEELDADELEELNELEKSAGGFDSLDEAEAAIYENPLSIDFRSGWVSCKEDMKPEEFMILLCTGGPAVRIIGEIDHNNEPHRAWVEYQDWGTPWTMLFDGQSDALEYARRLIAL